VKFNLLTLLFKKQPTAQYLTNLPTHGNKHQSKRQYFLRYEMNSFIILFYEVKV